MFNTGQQQTAPTAYPANTTPTSMVNEDHTVQISPVVEDKKIKDLNEKVASFEAKLQKSQEKQSILEQTVQNLIALLKSVFPFRDKLLFSLKFIHPPALALRSMAGRSQLIYYYCLPC